MVHPTPGDRRGGGVALELELELGVLFFFFLFLVGSTKEMRQAGYQ